MFLVPSTWGSKSRKQIEDELEQRLKRLKAAVSDLQLTGLISSNNADPNGSDIIQAEAELKAQFELIRTHDYTQTKARQTFGFTRYRKSADIPDAAITADTADTAQIPSNSPPSLTTYTRDMYLLSRDIDDRLKWIKRTEKTRKQHRETFSFAITGSLCEDQSPQPQTAVEGAARTDSPTETPTEITMTNLSLKGMNTSNQSDDQAKSPCAYVMYRPEIGIEEDNMFHCFEDLLEHAQTIIPFSDKESKDSSLFTFSRRKRVEQYMSLLNKTIEILSMPGIASRTMRPLVDYAKGAFEQLSASLESGYRFQLRDTDSGKFKQTVGVWEAAVEDAKEKQRVFAEIALVRPTTIGRAACEILATEQLFLSDSGKEYKPGEYVKINEALFTCEKLTEVLPKKLNLSILGEGKLPLSSGESCDPQRRGGYGDVHSIVNSGNWLSGVTHGCFPQEKVAVKVLSIRKDESEFLFCLKLVREIRVWSQLKNESIIPLLGLWKYQSGGKSYLLPVSPWCEQNSLNEHIEGIKVRFSLRKRLSLMRDVASGLVYLHKHSLKITHADLKPDNILIHNDRAYLTDFGLSMMDDGVGGFTTSLQGNCRYVPPETLSGEYVGHIRKMTAQGDMYSFGNVLYAVLTGKHPWQGKSNSEIHRIRSQHDKGASVHQQQYTKDISLVHWKFMVACWSSPRSRPSSEQAKNKLSEWLQELKD